MGSLHDERSTERNAPDGSEPVPNQGERYEQGERSQQRQYELGDPGAGSGEDPFHRLERLASGEEDAPESNEALRTTEPPGSR